MSEQVTIGGVTYLPSGIVAGEFGYSLDYISRLAREGRVEATRVGKKWFVEPRSVEQFVEESKLKKAQASAELSTVRKLELGEKTASDKGVVSPEVLIEPNRRRNIVTALAGSSMIMVAGLLAGVLHNPHILGFQERTSSTIQVGTPQVLVSDNSENVKTSLDTAVSDTRFKEHAPAVGMVVFPQTDEEFDTEKVTRSFSDEVKVEFLSENSGVVTPVFRSESETESYNFVVVPVDESS